MAYACARAYNNSYISVSFIPANELACTRKHSYTHVKIQSTKQNQKWSMNYASVAKSKMKSHMCTHSYICNICLARCLATQYSRDALNRWLWSRLLRYSVHSDLISDPNIQKTIAIKWWREKSLEQFEANQSKRNGSIYAIVPLWINFMSARVSSFAFQCILIRH